MSIPDQSHINRIRDALWQQPEGCASIMVGAGFSRNAMKAGPDAREFTLWQDLAMSLCSKLYPPGDGDRLAHAKAEASGTSGFLRLAQEYEAAFGRQALHGLLQKLVPDEDYVPDDMHVRLLRLPWRDIFTTNWDTLLERTRPFVADRAYGVVRTSEEIPSVPRPRIVKLHGSFPAHIPFIFTEEDYRTYPKKFAPFVNTVQQSMMETVLCLIGFSGDDPNFLHWSGWVRDNLGDTAPKIYLAGWLDLSPHRRRMLEQRNVVPIDIARHPQADSWPDHLRHRYATDWILHTLECGRPYEVSEWPSVPDWNRSPVPKLLLPVENVTVNAPVKEPSPPTGNEELTSLQEQVRAVISAWGHNRKVYPGWLFFPPSKHFLVGRSMDSWEQVIIRVVPELPPLERLSSMRELVWRRENLLEPLSEKVEAEVQATLEEIDCQLRVISGVVDSSTQWGDIREAWRVLEMALLTAARQRFNRELFDSRLAALQPFIDDHPDVVQRINHEKCLWALYDMDFEALEKLLKEWQPEGCDPVWMARKAAILVEIDRNDEAIRLLNRSLSIVRNTPRGSHTFFGPSREGWILWLALAFERRFGISTEESIVAPPAFKRWKELAYLLCDAFVQKQDFLRDLRGDPEKKDGPLFDFGERRGQTIRFSVGKKNQLAAASRTVRLCEVAGLPPSTPNVGVASDILELAADLLIFTNYALASRLVLRVSTSGDDATFNRVWARSRIAVMTMEEVSAMVKLVTNVISYALPRAESAGKSSAFWVNRLRVAIEALSRLVLRLPPEIAEETLNRGLSYYRMEGIVKNRKLHKVIEHLLTRAWEALPKSRRSDFVLDLLSAPIAGLDGFDASRHVYHDPGELLANDEDAPVPARTDENEGRWAEIVQMIIRGLGIGGEARRRASIRLLSLAFRKCLTVSEMKLVAQALWHTEFTGPDDLPSGICWNDWVFLLMPEPEPGCGERRFRGKWLSLQEHKNEEQFNKFFWHLGTALDALRKHKRPLKLTEEEHSLITSIIDEWCNLPVSSDEKFFVGAGTLDGIIGLDQILRESKLSSPVALKVFDKAKSMNQRSTPGFRLYGGLTKSLADRLEEIAMSLRMGLASDDVSVAEEAIWGLYGWLEATLDGSSQVPQPPDDLIQEVGVVIATRRKGALSRALLVARWIFAKGNCGQRATIAQLALSGLRYLFEELRYDREHGEEDAEEIPLLRWGCAHLALAMSIAGYESEPTVKSWAEVVKDDPLPEVRHAEGPVSSSTNELREEASDELSDQPLDSD